MELEKVKLAAQRFEAHFMPPVKPASAVAKLSAEGDGETPEDPADEGETDVTCGLVWYTGATVRRMGWDGAFNLTLSMDPAHVRMDRLKSGRAPLLNTHQSYELSDVIGVVESADLGAKQGTASVRFSSRPEVAGIRADVMDGIISNCSVGAAIYTLRDVTEPEDKVQSFLAIDWEPLELSMVPIGADMNAAKMNFAAGEATEYECVIQRATAQQGETTMENTNLTGASAATAAPVVPDVNVIRTEALASERKRVADIHIALQAARFPLDGEFAFSLTGSEVSIDQAREKILAKLAETSDRDPTHSGVAILRDATETRRTAIENALLHRYDPQGFKLAEGREYLNYTLLEMAKDAVQSTGKNPKGMNVSEVARLALQSTSDFPSILANVANKSLRNAYDAEPQTFKPFSKMTTANDFKPLNRVQLGDSQTLESVGPSGEFKYASMPDAKETYSLVTVGKIIALNRQTIINDDLDAFTRVPASQGRAAARYESDTVWGIITANANMGDGNALFSTAHTNYTSTGTVLSVASMGIGRKSMRTQTGLGGIGFLNLSPKYLVVPTALETIAQQFTVQTQIIYTKASDTNPFAGSLVVIPEPRLDTNSATAWYFIADPAQIDTVEYAYLSGQEGVYLETRMGFDVDGMELKARLDFAAKAIDWRGMYKNAGA